METDMDKKLEEFKIKLENMTGEEFDKMLKDNGIEEIGDCEEKEYYQEYERCKKVMTQAEILNLQRNCNKCNTKIIKEVLK